MTRNFDEELPTDLSFVVAGETFTMELAAPSVLAEFEDAEDVKTAAEAVQRARDRSIAFLQPGDRDRFTALMDEGKIPYVQVQKLQGWMLEVQTGRPTEQPSPSEPGRGGTAVSSRGRSS